MNTRVARLILAIVTITVTPALALACTCAFSDSCDVSWKRDQVVFLGTVTKKTLHEGRIDPGDRPNIQFAKMEVQFSVAENFRGGAPAGVEIVVYTGVGGGDCGYPFAVGSSYLVFASPYKDELLTGICNPTAPAVAAAGLLRELRAARDGETAASLFGTVGIGPRGVRYDDLGETKALNDVKVRAVGSTSTDYSTTTDKLGAYSFPSLPPDTYRLEFELPAGLSTWQQNRKESITVRVGDVSTALGCRVDVFAKPNGRISGVIIDAEGRPLAGFVIVKPADPKEAEVDLQRGGLPGYTTEDGSFSLDLIPPGRYQLLFYPKLEGKVRLNRLWARSEVIELGFGQQVENFELRVPNVRPSP